MTEDTGLHISGEFPDSVCFPIHVTDFVGGQAAGHEGGRISRVLKLVQNLDAGKGKGERGCHWFRGRWPLVVAMKFHAISVSANAWLDDRRPLCH